MTPQNQCMRCGACCALYRVSFDCRETDDIAGGVVPLHLTVKVNGTLSAMRGTEKRPIRCQALTGQIGRMVSCVIYDRRPSACRAFLMAWENDRGNSNCDRARAIYGLMPISHF
jgi:Fe-S-cluster containining protein